MRRRREAVVRAPSDGIKTSIIIRQQGAKFLARVIIVTK